MGQQPAIEIRGLRRSYGRLTVLDRIDLEVPRGDVVALLGPNGAGKTTTVRILATLLAPDAGTVRVAGHDVVRERHEVRRRIALTGQHAAVDGLLTGVENLRLMGRLAGLSRAAARRRADELLATFDLTDAATRRVATWSGGMRRRLDLAVSLVGRPEVVFLDEPTTGLDPRSRQGLWQVITELAGSGVTVFLTTQYLEEADRLADHLALIDGGRIVAEGTAADLKSRVAEQRLELRLVDDAAFDAAVAALGPAATARDRDRRLLAVPTDGSAAHVRDLLDRIDPHRTAVTRFAVHSATLDDVFLALTGRHTTTPEVTADV